MIDHSHLLFGNLSLDALSPFGTVGFAFAYAGNFNDPSAFNRSKPRKWYGSIKDRFGNISDLYYHAMDHQLQWQMPEALLGPLTTNFQRLAIIVPRSLGGDSTSNMREERETLLNATVHLCVTGIKTWALYKYAQGEMTAEDVHSLGFLLLGENGGRHAASEPTRAIAEVKVGIVSSDSIHVVIDQAATANAGPVVNGKPHKVKNAVIVITADDGLTEIYRGYTTRLHNDIRMPAGSHGKQFIIRAAFLRHIGDEPNFGSEVTFTMPLTTRDLASGKGSES